MGTNQGNSSEQRNITNCFETSSGWFKPYGQAQKVCGKSRERLSFQNGFLINIGQCLNPLCAVIQVGDPNVKDTPQTTTEAWWWYSFSSSVQIIGTQDFSQKVIRDFRDVGFFYTLVPSLFWKFHSWYLAWYSRRFLLISLKSDSFDHLWLSNWAWMARPMAVFDISSLLIQFYARSVLKISSFLISHLKSSITSMWLSLSDESMVEADTILNSCYGLTL